MIRVVLCKCILCMAMVSNFVLNKSASECARNSCKCANNFLRDNMPRHVDAVKANQSEILVRLFIENNLLGKRCTYRELTINTATQSNHRRYTALIKGSTVINNHNKIRSMSKQNGSMPQFGVITIANSAIGRYIKKRISIRIYHLFAKWIYDR